MIGLGVTFQNGSDPHRYRGWGKSTFWWQNPLISRAKWLISGQFWSKSDKNHHFRGCQNHHFPENPVNPVNPVKSGMPGWCRWEPKNDGEIWQNWSNFAIFLWFPGTVSGQSFGWEPNNGPNESKSGKIPEFIRFYDKMSLIPGYLARDQRIEGPMA